jgi:hypothetical protein
MGLTRDTGCKPIASDVTVIAPKSPNPNLNAIYILSVYTSTAIQLWPINSTLHQTTEAIKVLPELECYVAHFMHYAIVACYRDHQQMLLSCSSSTRTVGICKRRQCALFQKQHQCRNKKRYQLMSLRYNTMKKMIAITNNVK